MHNFVQEESELFEEVNSNQNLEKAPFLWTSLSTDNTSHIDSNC